MRDGIPILMLSVLAIGGVGFWLTRLDAFNPTRTRVGFTPSAETNEKPKTSAAGKSSITKPRAESAHIKPHAVEETTMVVSVKVPETSPPNATPSEPPPFPNADQIRINTHKLKISERFGSPALSAMTTDQGHTMETFVYERDRGRALTIIRFKDGEVFSVYSQ